MVFKTHSVQETEKKAAELALSLYEKQDSPRFIALDGDLGVGKTAFARGFTAALNPKASVKSPTFALVREYPNGDRSVYHFDMYRIESEEDLYSIGFDDYLERPGFFLVEWADRISYAFPDHLLHITIKKDPSETDGRSIEIEEIGGTGG